MELAQEEGGLHLVVRDDGIGFDMERMRGQAAQGGSMGMLGMTERASLLGGRIELKSSPGQGTEVHAWFPLARAAMAVNGADDLIVQ
jgi:signal transduction histidine kinase